MNDRYDPDLTRFDDEYEKSSSEREYAPIPDGKYEVHVNDVVLKPTKSGDGSRILWTLEITKGPCEKRLLFHSNQLVTPENLRFAKADLFMCGIKDPKISDAVKKLGQLHGLRLLVTVKTKGEYQNNYFDEVLTEDEIHPDEDDPIPF